MCYCLLLAVIDVIQAYAFSKNPYPVTLSIENHCGLEQKARLAQIMRNTFGDMVFVVPDDDVLPSLRQLKRKILVKGLRIAQGKVEKVCINNIAYVSLICCPSYLI